MEFIRSTILRILFVEWLSEVKSKEYDDDTFFNLDPHYVEIAHIYLDVAKDEIPQADRVRALIKDIRTIRMDRARMGMLYIASQAQNGDVIRCIGVWKYFHSRFLNTIIDA